MDDSINEKTHALYLSKCELGIDNCAQQLDMATVNDFKPDHQLEIPIQEGVSGRIAYRGTISFDFDGAEDRGTTTLG